jgi:ATP adenylyltransferase
MALERFSAAWREGYVTSEAAQTNAKSDGECVFCVLVATEISLDSGVIAKTEHCFAVLNAFPYGSGHVLVLPQRHVAGLGELTDDEYRDFTDLLRRVVLALERAYGADGMNVGFNLGKAAGAGIPKHLHAHALPRWNGDTNFMTSIGETRVLPESLSSTWSKVHEQLG